MYNETVLQHFRNPRNVGEMEDADGIGIYMSDFCGDITKFWIRVSEETALNGYRHHVEDMVKCARADELTSINVPNTKARASEAFNSFVKFLCISKL